MRTYYITRTDDYSGLSYDALERPFRDNCGNMVDVIVTVRASSRQMALEKADAAIERHERFLAVHMQDNKADLI